MLIEFIDFFYFFKLGSGVNGANAISKILQSRYKELEFVFDEGSFIMEKVR